MLSDAGSTPAASTTSRLARGGFGAVVRQAAPPFGLANVLDSRRLQIPHFVRSLSAARLGFARRISFVALGTTPGVSHFPGISANCGPRSRRLPVGSTHHAVRSKSRIRLPARPGSDAHAAGSWPDLCGLDEAFIAARIFADRTASVLIARWATEQIEASAGMVWVSREKMVRLDATWRSAMAGAW